MRIVAGIAIAAAGLGAVALASVLLAPSETTLLQAAVSAQDYGIAAEHSAAAREPGGIALAMRALLGSGHTAAALARIDAQIAADPADPALLRTRAALLGRLGRQAEQAMTLDRIARRTGRVSDLRALATLSARRGDTPVLRAMLTALADSGHAAPAEIEALARLESQAGDRPRALARLAALPRLSGDGAALALALAGQLDDPARLAALVARLRAAGHAVPDDAALIARLAADGRADMALAFAERTADPSASLIQRIALLRGLGRADAAAALLSQAIATPAIRIAPAEIVRIAYELDRVPLILAAADAGRVTRVPVPIARDLARRALADGRIDRIARIDAIAAGDWRATDPWTALQLAQRSGDPAAMLRYAARLPADRVAGVAEAAYRAQGDRAGLRRLLLAEPGDPAAVAARLDAAGFRPDAERLLRMAADTAGPADPATQRLLYRWGPRPDATALGWLRQRAADARDPAVRRAWLALYADRDRPDRALAVLAADPLATSTPLLLIRLRLAAAADQGAATQAAADALLDGRPLAAAELRQIAAVLPAAAAPRTVIAARLAAAGQASPQMRRDLAWTALGARRIGEARGHAAALLTAMPGDAATLSLAGEIEQADGKSAAARGLFARALAATPIAPDTAAARAGLLERLGRTREALALVRTLPDDAARRSREARLLIAIGRPAAASALLADAR